MKSLSTGLIRSHSSSQVFVFRLFDAVIIVLTLLLTLYVEGGASGDQYLLIVLLAIICFSIVGPAVGIYQSLRGATLSQLVWPVIISWGIAVLTLLLLPYFFKSSSEYSRTVIGVWFVIAPLILMIWRLAVGSVLSYFHAKGYSTHSVTIVGVGDCIGCAIKEIPLYESNLKDYKIYPWRLRFTCASYFLHGETK